ncbi:ATP-binding protein [Microcoleus sp. FACHB-672]|uniref:ATP-binding protein n=1 Tax=Microcoleus sp. FACHB-672 TaxID=2692825 RepID=UPI0016842CA8|nr:ATP-binding protein [Microcoleus sp. FACHB-672]MBD2040935.1 amino acid permease [Microcoleus sp. FACHB-672]
MHLDAGNEQIHAYPPDKPVLGVKQNSPTPLRLQRSLSFLETWGFGLSGHIAWIGTATAMHAALGPGAIVVWLPTVFIGILLNRQVKRLGEQWPEMSGGTPNYITRLLKDYPGLGRYAALAYFISWATYLPVNAIILTDLIQANLEPLGIACPKTLLRIGFTVIAYIMAFSGTRALAILHAVFIFPAVGFLLLFGIQGMGWLAFSPDSPGLFPSAWPTLTFVDWAKWSFFGVYGACSCENASAFVADSRQPNKTLQCLTFAGWLLVPVFLGNSWVLARLATSPGLGEDSFANLLTAASPFWGSSATFLVTLLLASSCLLLPATAVSTCPRILYQLALDGHLAPVFTVVSPQGVLGPGLIFSLLFSLISLLWGDVARIVVVGCAGYMVTLMAFHLGFWLRRKFPEVRLPPASGSAAGGKRFAFLPWLSLGFFAVDAVFLVVGGLAWSREDVLIGLMLPVVTLAVDAAIRRSRFGLFRPNWWIQRYRGRHHNLFPDFVAFQVVILIFLICSAVAVGWAFGLRLYSHSSIFSNFLVVLLLTAAFVGVAIACWTSLPQVFAMNQAREAAEHLFTIALDAIVVLDENGMIRQANPAAERLFEISSNHLVGCHLNQWLPGLANDPEQWLSRSEQTLNQPNTDPSNSTSLSILEVAISDRFSQDASLSNRDLQEYVVILRDITERKQAEEALQKANEKLETRVEKRTNELRKTVEQLQTEIQERQRVEENLRAMQNQIVVQEKLASLGSLTAGIAHEIRNPLNFVTNFSELSAELAQELFEEIENQAERLDATTIEYFAELLNDLKQNLQKINHHGQRADSIVSNMLLHSRGQSGHWEPTDINKLLADYVNLAYHGMRAKEGTFNLSIETDYDAEIGKIEVVPQDISRVFLNIINNACYSTHKKKQTLENDFSPVLCVKTKNLEDRVEIRIRDNGKGMTSEVQDKIFNPFFTTKPAGEGTGLGLSLSHDIIVGQHRGELSVESEAEEYAEFIIVLPKKPA